MAVRFEASSLEGGLMSRTIVALNTTSSILQQKPLETLL